MFLFWCLPNVILLFLGGLFSLQVLWENSESIQTAFRASHGKAHSLGSLNFIVLCEEIILLCSLILALASFIQCPLAQGSAEPFLIYLCHSSHYFINHSKSFSRICLWGWGALVRLLFSNQIVISKPPLPAERHRHGNAWKCSELRHMGLERNRICPFPSFPQKSSACHMFGHCFVNRRLVIVPTFTNMNYPLNFEINLELTESNSEGWARNKQRSTRMFLAKYTWTCSFQNHRIVFSCSLGLVFFLRVVFFNL